MKSPTTKFHSSEVKVWDPLVRVFHWSLVAGFFAAYFAEGEWMQVHVWAGYGVCVLIIMRIVWGFTGTQHARFRDFVFPPTVVLSYFKQVVSLNAKRFIGHNPAGGAMIILLLVLVLLTTITGMMLYGADAWLGPLASLMKDVSEENVPWLKTVHEFSANGTIVCIFLHVAGVIWESRLHKENLIVSMINGRKRRVD